MAHEGLWEQLVKLDRQETAKRAKCQYLSEPERYIVTLLNTDYIVNLSDRQIFSVSEDSSQMEAGFIEQLCILAYLINAQDLPLTNKLVKPERLPSGQFFFRGLHSLPTQKLEETFGSCTEVLQKVAEQFCAKRCEFGDASIELNVLSRVPLTIVIWRGDDEFPARASILFDETAGEQLPLDALGAAVELTVETLVKAAGEGV
ncbi:MAG: DUF3786 domain-containing protein [Planctomycetota bacterium]|jgi:hypothetical protein